MTIRIEVKYGALDRYLARLEDMPTPQMVSGLNRNLSQNYGRVLRDIHDETGELASKTHMSSRVTPNTWTGDIVAGSDHAVYEMERGGTHDFTRSFDEIYADKYVDIVDRIL